MTKEEYIERLLAFCLSDGDKDWPEARAVVIKYYLKKILEFK